MLFCALGLLQEKLSAENLCKIMTRKGKHNEVPPTKVNPYIAGQTKYCPQMLNTHKTRPNKVIPTNTKHQKARLRQSQTQEY